MPSHLDDLAYAHGAPACHGSLRSVPDDFIVEELLGFEPSGEGEHVFLYIEKRNTNTQWLAQQLARFAEVKQVDVGYSGLKDRDALTRQWFSVKLAGKAEPDWLAFNNENITIIKQTRNNKKIRRGTHKANRFKLVIRDIDCDAEYLDARLMAIKQQGVPNYFMQQRFSRDDANLQKAQEMFAGRIIKNRNKRGLYLSAARSYLFNLILSKRVAQSSWNQPQQGDAMILAGTHSYFVIDELTDEITDRCHGMDIHPSGALWGAGPLATQTAIAELEQAVVNSHGKSLADGLQQAGLKQERRPLRLAATNLQWALAEPAILEISFELLTGSYATAVIRELVQTTSRHPGQPQ